MICNPDSSSSDPVSVDQAVAVLRSGGLVAFPTETVYGLGADATNPEAIALLYEVKGRPANRPLTVHLADPADIALWAADIPPAAQRLIARFCPGPLTIILPRRSQVLDAVTAGHDSVGVRLPSHPLALQLIRAFGGGLVAPSANRSGYLSPTCAEHVRQELAGSPVTILDGGFCELGIESTIVDFSQPQPRLLRLGVLSHDLLQEAAGIEIVKPELPSGCQAERHYHPRTPAFLTPTAALVERAVEQLSQPAAQVALVHFSPLTVPDLPGLRDLPMPDTPQAYGRQLYEVLRYLDSCCLAAIVIEDLPTDSSWEAVRERVLKATETCTKQGALSKRRN